MPPSQTGLLRPAGLNSFSCQSVTLCLVCKLRQCLPRTWFSLLEITCGLVIYGCTAVYPRTWWLKQEPFHCISPTCGSDMRARLPGAPTGVFGRLGSARPGDRSAYTSQLWHGAHGAVDFIQRPRWPTRHPPLPPISSRPDLLRSSFYAHATRMNLKSVQSVLL